MKKLILWDFDGVIVSSWHTSFEVMRLHTPDVDETSYRKRFEGNIHHDPDMVKAIDTEGFNYSKEYRPRILKLPLVPGIEEVLEKLDEDPIGYKSVIISSASGEMISTFLQGHNIIKYFEGVYGHEVHTSKVEKIRMAFEAYDSNAENGVFITDTLGDIKEAQEHSLKTIAVLWGYHTRETLEKGSPDVITEKPHELYTLIKSII